MSVNHCKAANQLAKSRNFDLDYICLWMYLLDNSCNTGQVFILQYFNSMISELVNELTCISSSQ